MTKESKEACEKIAQDAINGKNSDPTGGATFFILEIKLQIGLKIYSLVLQLEVINSLKVLRLINKSIKN